MKISQLIDKLKELPQDGELYNIHYGKDSVVVYVSNRVLSDKEKNDLQWDDLYEVSLSTHLIGIYPIRRE